MGEPRHAIKLREMAEDVRYDIQPSVRAVMLTAAALIASQAEAVERAEEALRGPAAWLERWAAHIGNCNGGSVCTCGLTLARHEIAAARAFLDEEREGG